MTRFIEKNSAFKPKHNIHETIHLEYFFWSEEEQNFKSQFLYEDSP